MAASPTPKIKQKLVILLAIMAVVFLLLSLRLLQVSLILGEDYA